MKPGIKSTEFWGKSAAQVLVVVAALAGVEIEPAVALAAVAGLEAVYTIGRTIVKAFDWPVEEIE